MGYLTKKDLIDRIQPHIADLMRLREEIETLLEEVEDALDKIEDTLQEGEDD